MKRFLSIFLTLFSVLMVSAQSENLAAEALLIEQQIIKSNDFDQQSVVVPEQWKNESAVILFQEQAFTAEGNMQTYYWHGWVHKRILLQDKAAVEKFSQLAFVNADNRHDFIGLTIYKQNGQIVNVDKKEAVRVDILDVLEGVYLDFALLDFDDNNCLKIAVPNIEVGDIIDYYCYNFYKDRPQYFTSSAIPSVWLNDEYPIIYQQVEYNIGPRVTFNLKSVNGAPKLQKQQPGYDATGILNEDFTTYFLNDSLCNSYSNERFQKLERCNPRIRAHIGSDINKYYKSAAVEHIFYSEENSIDYTATDADILIYLKKMDISIVDNTKLVQHKAVLENKCANCSPFQKARLLYYSWIRSGWFYSNENISIVSFSSLLGKFKIDHKLLLIIPNNIGTIENLIRPDEFIIAISVKDQDNNDKYFFVPSTYRNVNEYSSQIENANAYVYYPRATFKIKPENKTKAIEKTRLPKSNPENHIFGNIMNVSFAPNQELVGVKSEFHVTGYQKNRVSEMVLYGYDLSAEQEQTIGIQKIGFNPPKDYLQEKPTDEEFSQMISQRNKRLLEFLSEEYEIDSLFRTEVLNSGCFEDSELRYSQEFTVKNMYSKAGKNILFDLGKLIGSQISLEEKDLERKNDIYYPYPCIFSYNITVTLPEGYYAEKIDAFNVSIDNSCMSLQSQVTADANQLHFTFRKEYKNSFDTKDKWPEYVEVLEAAYKITQQKLVLKPL